MNFYDTAKDGAERTGQTIHEIIEQAKPYQTAHVTVLLMLILSAACFAAGWALGFGAGVTR